VSEADPQDRNSLHKVGEKLHGDTRILGPPGSRRDNQVADIHVLGLLDIDLIVAKNLYLGSEHPQGLFQIIGERIIIIEK